MRALRVVGVTGDGSVVLEDPGRRERYTVPADEQLRAAARGDVTRLGQIAIELESQLRPREIQARIRGGASVDEVAAAAGVPTQKIERFAYPVLLERSRTAELAQGAHPQRTDGPDSRTLGETVAHTFGLRGQDYTSAGWDSWKGEDGKWIVVLTWQTGRSDNAAHWAFQPGAHGGTVVALDEHASDLVEGLPARPLRPLGAVVDMARDEDDTPAPAPSEPARAVAGGQAPPPAEAWAGRGIAPEQRRSSPPSRPRVETPARQATRADEARPPAAAAPVIPRIEPDDDATPSPTDTAGAPEDPGPDTAGTGTGAVEASSAVEVEVPSTDASEPRDSATGPAGSGTGTADAGTGPAGTGPTASGTGTAGTGPTASGTAPVGSEAAPARSDAASGTAPTDAPSSEPDAGDAADAAAGASPAAGADTVAGAPDAVTAAGETAPAETELAETEPAGTPADPDTSPAPSTVAEDAPPATDGAEDTASEPAARPRGGGASRRTKKGKPVMPSWDEVLLGVRGQR